MTSWNNDHHRKTHLKCGFFGDQNASFLPELLAITSGKGVKQKYE